MIDLHARLGEIEMQARAVQDEAGTAHEECAAAADKLVGMIERLRADVASAGAVA